MRPSRFSLLASLSLMSLLPLSAQTPGFENGFPTAPFGIGADYHTNQTAADNAKWIPQMVSIGIKYHRTCDTGWEAVEREQGKWTWDNLDAQMDYLASQHMQFGGIFAGNAPWNTLDPQGNLPVKNIAAWSNYVSQLVTHVHGKIHYWEVWNEPPNGTGRDQTPADYAKIVIAAYDAAKKADPNCLIGLATKSVDLSYLSQAIKAGAKDHFDYVTLHPYESLDGEVDNLGTEPVFMSIVPTVRKMLADLDPAKKDVPVVLTEIGCDAHDHGEDGQASALVKAFTMCIAQGITCVNWFEGMDGDSGPMAMLKADGTPRLSYHAYARLIKTLGPQPEYMGWVLFNAKDYGFVYQGATGPVVVTWASRATTDPTDFGAPVTVTNAVSGEASQESSFALTSAPVYVTGVPDSLLAQARANKGKPLTWGGDFSAAKSVSISFGQPGEEKGLHSHASASVAAAVLAYGGAARSGDVPGGNVFNVDPAFLSYTSTPIEISVVVRRNAANDNAGFKLTYESATGFKSLGWYTVPDNKEWHTVTWKITDAQFVSMWNYNFALNSDGDKFNKYDIQSVTVTKLSP
jgi:hypothetical protein